MRTESEFRALLLLLGDEEDRVANVAWETLLAEAEAALPFLSEAADSPDARIRGRARLLQETLRHRELVQQWQRFAAVPDDDLDLERGALLLSRLAGPVDEDAVRRFLDATAGMVRSHLVAVGGMQALTEVLFDNLGFRGGPFDQSDSHYLSRVLERRSGIPILLATVYVLVGRRAGLPVSGVAMPGHYLARFDRPDGPVFIDCYNRGQTYRFDTLTGLLRARGIDLADHYLAPCTDRFSLFRMLNNLEQVYAATSDTFHRGMIVELRESLGVKRADV